MSVGGRIAAAIDGLKMILGLSEVSNKVHENGQRWKTTSADEM